jgi:hypothetical protein
MKAGQIQRVGYTRPGVGYVGHGQPATVLEPDGDWTYLAGQIYPTWDRICSIVPGSHDTRTRPGSDKYDASDMFDLGSDISN